MCVEIISGNGNHVVCYCKWDRQRQIMLSVRNVKWDWYWVVFHYFKMPTVLTLQLQLPEIVAQQIEKEIRFDRMRERERHRALPLPFQRYADLPGSFVVKKAGWGKCDLKKVKKEITYQGNLRRSGNSGKFITSLQILSINTLNNVACSSVSHLISLQGQAQGSSLCLANILSQLKHYTESVLLL